MKKFLTLLLLSCQPASASDEVGDLKMIAQALSDTESVECEFVQTRRTAMVSGELISEGRMSFRRPDSLMWEYISPHSLKLVSGGGRTQLLRDGRVTQAGTGIGGMLKEMAGMLLDCISGRGLSDGRIYDVRVREKEEGYAVSLMPKKQSAKQFFAEIVLHFGKDAGDVTGVEVKENGGDSTVIEFKNIRRRKNGIAQ